MADEKRNFVQVHPMPPEQWMDDLCWGIQWEMGNVLHGEDERKRQEAMYKIRSGLEQLERLLPELYKIFPKRPEKEKENGA